MIDFYFACKDFFSYDIAILINAWCFPDNNFNKIFMNNILKGYESIRKLQIIEKKKLNVLLRGSSLRFLLTRIIDIQKKTKNKLLEIKNPEDFLKRLIFHRTISNENYGI
jgi:homoserine kinase type II